MNQPLSDILFHLAEAREDYFDAVAPPIVQSSNFAFRTLDDFRRRIANEKDNHVYTRGNNPTVDILRQKMAALEGAEDALVTGSGSSAIAIAVMANVAAGDHIVCVKAPYAWTFSLMSKMLPRFGITTTFVDGTDIDHIRAAIRPNTKVLYLESPNSLTFQLQDLVACAALAREFGLVSIIDNSHCTPIFQRPIEWGIDVVVHSATKYLNGHSDVVVGVVCASEPMIAKIFAAEYMTLGTIISPHDAALVIRGLRTLPLRMQRSEESCQKIIAYLRQHPKVARIYHAFDPESPQFSLAQKQMSGNGGLFSIELKINNIEAAENFFHRLKRFTFAVSWGGYESLVFPTCALYGIEGRTNPPLPFSFYRFYIGLEDPDWLIEDLEQALKAL